MPSEVNISHWIPLSAVLGFVCCDDELVWFQKNDVIRRANLIKKQGTDINEKQLYQFPLVSYMICKLKVYSEIPRHLNHVIWLHHRRCVKSQNFDSSQVTKRKTWICNILIPLKGILCPPFHQNMTSWQVGHLHDVEEITFVQPNSSWKDMCNLRWASQFCFLIFVSLMFFYVWIYTSWTRKAARNSQDFGFLLYECHRWCCASLVS